MTGSDEPLHIVHLAASDRWTGVAEPAAMLAAAQQGAGHRVRFVCAPGGGFARRVSELGLQGIDGLTLERGAAALMRDVAQLRAYVEHAAPDVIHCHLPHDHWIAALALRRPGLRGGPRRPAVVRTLHRSRSIRTDLVHRWLAGKGTDLWIAVSQADRRALVERVGLPTAKVVWVRGAVDLERFRPGLSPEPIRREAGIPPGARVAGIVARLQPHRGHHWFLDTIEAVASAVPEVHYLIAGRGELKYELLARIRAHRLAERLHRIGYRRFDLPETYAAMDVVLLLAPGNDGSCRAMLEAMACGRPVIGARLGAIADTIEEGVNGWLVEPGDREGLARAIVEALSDLERTRRMGDAARRLAQERHSRVAQYTATVEAYRAAMAARDARFDAARSARRPAAVAS